MDTEPSSVDTPPGHAARRAARPGAALALAALLAGCVVGPDFHRPENAPPAGWPALDAAAAAPAAAASAAPASRLVARAYDGRTWWAVFGDPILDGLVDEALRQNLDLQTAALRIEEARAQRGAAAAQGRPTVSGNGIAGRQRASENGLTSALGGGGSSSGGSGSGSSAPPSPYSDLYQVGFDATWELDLWGKARRGVEAADAGIESAEQARGNAQISLTAEVARTYLALRGYQRQRAIALADADDERRLAQLVDDRSRHGFASQADAVAQQAQLSSALAQLPPIDAQVDQSANRLALLLALPPGALAQRLGGAPAAEPPLPPEVPVGLPGDLLRRRPDVAKSEADLHAATAKVGQAKAQLFPSIELGGFGGLQASHAGDLTDWASRFWAGGLQVTIPIFEGGKLKAQIRTADAQMKEAALNYRGTVLSAYHDANDAISAYAQEQRHAEALDRQLRDARRSRDLTRERWRSGFVSLIEVLDIQRQLHQSEQQALQSRVAASTDLVALYKALGGDWNAGDRDR
jgi:NodT family efflux transporter outer membrane factor (OMF) lipoprotein